MDCHYALQASIPHLTRSSLHRCPQRLEISRLPDVEGSKPRAAFKAYPIGFFHIDIAEVRTEQGKLYLLVAIDRTSKFAVEFAKLELVDWFNNRRLSEPIGNNPPAEAEARNYARSAEFATVA